MLMEAVARPDALTIVETLKAELAGAGAIETLKIMHSLPTDEQGVAFRLLAKDHALALFEQLDTDQQHRLLRSFTAEAATEVVEALAPDARVRLLDELPATVATRLIDALSPAEREATNTLMGYAPETAGRIMTPEFVSLRGTLTAAEALDRVRELADQKETIYTLYVTSPARVLEGVLSLRELLLADPDAVLADVMSRPVVSVVTDADQEKVAHLLQELDLLAVPVVDKERRLVGIVTVDDAIDILEQEATEDLYDNAGLADVTSGEADRSSVLISGSLWSIWKVRLPFLLITLVAGMLAGLVIEGFEEALESIAAVAVFIPLIMDMGGNVGTQSSTLFARGVALGHIHMSQFRRHFLKELRVGLSLGLLVGTISGVVAGVWQGLPLLGVAVGLALVAAMTLAALLGFLVPFVLIRLNIDQAAGSAPIITSIKDIAGLMIYFSFVSLFLAHLT
ncbi:magnesium transporter [Xylanimonas protaetiae]|uniref:Magnesium transporter MgtE n=1 Tax=Xylanimonas protaetiae TaxID=2509457 RepID=A0A4P6F4S1_9MICO|nr:magnesium transporter [Xylanimonas protaetiae]QAY69723.1 magnesium transporter [Xylanimonas protaetiae]